MPCIHSLTACSKRDAVAFSTNHRKVTNFQWWTTCCMMWYAWVSANTYRCTYTNIYIYIWIYDVECRMQKPSIYTRIYYLFVHVCQYIYIYISRYVCIYIYVCVWKQFYQTIYCSIWHFDTSRGPVDTWMARANGDPSMMSCKRACTFGLKCWPSCTILFTCCSFLLLPSFRRLRNFQASPSSTFYRSCTQITNSHSVCVCLRVALWVKYLILDIWQLAAEFEIQKPHVP